MFRPRRRILKTIIFAFATFPLPTLAQTLPVHNDLDADGKSDILIRFEDAFEVTLTSPSPIDGSNLVSGNLDQGFGFTIGALSATEPAPLVLGVQDTSPRMTWSAVDPFTEWTGKIYTFGFRGDKPILGCYHQSRFVPARTSTSGNGSKALLFLSDGRLREFRLDGTPLASSCTPPDDRGSSFFAFLWRKDKRPQLSIYSILGKRQGRPIAVPGSWQSPRLFSLPIRSGESALIGILARVAGKTAAFLLNPYSRDWETLPVSSDLAQSVIVQVNTGEDGAGGRWVAAIDLDGKVHQLNVAAPVAPTPTVTPTATPTQPPTATPAGTATNTPEPTKVPVPTATPDRRPTSTPTPFSIGRPR